MAPSYRSAGTLTRHLAQDGDALVPEDRAVLERVLAAGPPPDPDAVTALGVAAQRHHAGADGTLSPYLPDTNGAAHVMRGGVIPGA